ncbi:TrmH family RNA methyltransferase [Candidatus Moduliflexota bacterium]
MSHSRPSKEIRSKSNAAFKDLKKLAHSSRERRQRGLVFLEGSRLVETYRRLCGDPELTVVNASAAPAGSFDSGGRGGVRRVVLSEDLVRQVTTLSSPPAVMAVASRPGPRSAAGGDALFLEGIQDPGNVGMVLRSAAGAGVKRVCLSRGCADPWSPKCLRSGMGAHFALSIEEESDLPGEAGRFGGAVIALVPGSRRSLYQEDLTGEIAFAVGSEGSGLTAALKGSASRAVSIPMPGWEESLNAAAAATICLYEMVRQRTAESR